MKFHKHKKQIEVILGAVKKALMVFAISAFFTFVPVLYSLIKSYEELHLWTQMPFRVLLY